MRDAGNTLVNKMLRAQIGLSIVLAAAMWPFGFVAAYSGLIGGAVATAATLALTLWVFRPYRAQQVGSIVSRFLGGEIAKMAVMVLAFTSVFLWVEPLSVAALFGCFIVVYLVPVAVAARG